MVLAELRELVFPFVPELRKPVQENDEWPLAGGDIVQPHAIDLDVAIPELRISIPSRRCRSTHHGESSQPAQESNTQLAHIRYGTLWHRTLMAAGKECTSFCLHSVSMQKLVTGGVPRPEAEGSRTHRFPKAVFEAGQNKMALQ